jgi:F0F1-type ATP synthase assembly protein I
MASLKKRNAWLTAFNRALPITTLGWDLAVPIVGGALLGHALNGRYHTGPVVTLALLLLGVLVGVYNVWRQLGTGFGGEQSVAHRVSERDGFE